MEIKKGQIYKHYKSDHTYKIIDVGIHSETLEEMVVYEALYENKMGSIWIRSLKMWFEEVEWDGKKVKRFELISQ
ncbi:MAG: DUF1653 domain-containing protein [Candidatus Shapirobacteria bacterium]